MADELQTQKQEAEMTEGVERTRSARVYIPHVDIFSAGDDIIILADMPGVAEKDIDIMLDKDVLTINGYISDPVLPEEYELAHGEYGIGDYQRSFTLPDEVDRNNVEASLSDGVLTVTLPKAPEAQARKITVKTG
jgi:HSP20 family molecular chaperone IbpA